MEDLGALNDWLAFMDTRSLEIERSSEAEKGRFLDIQKWRFWDLGLNFTRNGVGFKGGQRSISGHFRVGRGEIPDPKRQSPKTFSP